jgi:hypothetical protein
MQCAVEQKEYKGIAGLKFKRSIEGKLSQLD